MIECYGACKMWIIYDYLEKEAGRHSGTHSPHLQPTKSNPLQYQSVEWLERAVQPYVAQDTQKNHCSKISLTFYQIKIHLVSNWFEMANTMWGVEGGRNNSSLRHSQLSLVLHQPLFLKSYWNLQTWKTSLQRQQIPETW